MSSVSALEAAEAVAGETFTLTDARAAGVVVVARSLSVVSPPMRWELLFLSPSALAVLAVRVRPVAGQV